MKFNATFHYKDYKTKSMIIKLNPKDKISKYVHAYELTRSRTAEKNEIDNNINNLEILFNCTLVAKMIFDPVREMIGKPLGITSFYRCKLLNTIIGGSKTSQHIIGQAIDIDADKYGYGSNKQIFDFIKSNLDFDQLINEYNYSWIHVSYKLKGNRKEVKHIS